ncbi:MAG: sensor histidine kinase [Chloroflexi bacterium]|nr:sensor histidine kinase [Chloroflexota bacterium]
MPFKLRLPWRLPIPGTSLAQQFMLASFVILVVGMLIIGAWTGAQIERGVINQTGSVTALYVDSFVAPQLQNLANEKRLDAAHQQTLDQMMTSTPLGKRIVAFKVWSPDGEILYSTTPVLIGRRFPVGLGLQRALAGQVASHISLLQEPENTEERRNWSRLLETYAPVRLAGTEQIIAISEFYQTLDNLSFEIALAQGASWIVVGVCTLLMYVLLAGIVGRGSRTITRQQSELEEKVVELRALLDQNAHLNERLRRAGARTTALNERYLRRISADLHDGPGQDVSFAMLRLYSIADRCAQCAAPDSEGRPLSADFNAIRTSLANGLTELRAISTGLRLPELDTLSPAETVERAVRGYEGMTGRHVQFDSDVPSNMTSIPIKIALYRLVQEALANGFRHAPGAAQSVRLWREGHELCLQVTDSGPGFAPENFHGDDGHLGVAGMRERVLLLGGSFEVLSHRDTGTCIRARVPEQLPDE